MHDATKSSTGEPPDEDLDDALFAEERDLDGAHIDLAATFSPAAGPSHDHGYAWRCRGTDSSGCDEVHSGTSDWTDSGVEECSRHGLRLEYRLP